MKKQLLLIDDEPAILKLLYLVLSADYDLVVKFTAIEALDWLQQGNFPDLIVTDYKLPYMNGLSFIQSLKLSGLYRHIPVFLLSGEDLTEGGIKEFPYPITFFKKPFNPSVLKSAIVNVLN